MATTTNFGWETPDDTDLVKDGAAAIRTALGGVDTSFVDLKGGTTGQVLSKASNTDLDYTWVTTDDANAIQNSIVDAKGDLIAASANDTPVRLAVGNNGETLVADSSTATGLKWATPASGGGMTSLASGSLTGGALTLSSISASYNELWLYISNVYSASANAFYLGFNNITTGAKYSQLKQSASATATVSAASANNGWNTANFGMDINSNDWLANTSGNNYIIRIPNYTTSANKIIDVLSINFLDGGTNRGLFRSIIGFYDTNAISRIDLTNATSGTYVLYGVK